MSDFYKKVGEKIEQAQANAPFYVWPYFKNKAAVMRMMGPNLADMAMTKIISNNEAEDACEDWNRDWVGREVLNFIKDELMQKLSEGV